MVLSGRPRAGRGALEIWDAHLGWAVEGNVRFALASLMAVASVFRAQALDTRTAKCIALNLTEGSLDLGYSGRVVLLLLLKSQDVTVLDAGGPL